MTGKDALFVQRLAQTFDRTERTVLALHYCEELTPMEIGLVIDFAPHQVEQILDSIRQRTRAALEERETAGTAA